MAFYKSGVERMIQAARARRIACGALCVPGTKPHGPSYNSVGYNPTAGTAGLYSSWLNQGGGQGGATSTGGNTPTGNEHSGNGSGRKKNGVNKFGCTANVGIAGSSCKRTPGGTYDTLAACIAGTECSE